ncbi:hypothetical protein EVAR_74402_1 [Eumeta japonica]|uniref:Uncharacterized protein n=1 Tax=Eumeta variegata TaxID=151549 RepID=A0A4C1SDE2_EUMVA|nr:hypothetical protein EVAR_74402_1 [Eumeta japonica]
MQHAACIAPLVFESAILERILIQRRLTDIEHLGKWRAVSKLPPRDTPCQQTFRPVTACALIQRNFTKRVGERERAAIKKLDLDACIANKIFTFFYRLRQNVHSVPTPGLRRPVRLMTLADRTLLGNKQDDRRASTRHPPSNRARALIDV